MFCKARKIPLPLQDKVTEAGTDGQTGHPRTGTARRSHKCISSGVAEKEEWRI